MALIDSLGYSHVRLTVTDIARSKAFYDKVFGWTAVIDNSDHAGEPGVSDSPEKFYAGVLYKTPQGTLFGLRPVGNEGFHPDRTGLDHVSFAVATRGELEDAATALTREGIEHGEVRELPSGIAILSFQDPDDINLELTAPLT